MNLQTRLSSVILDIFLCGWFIAGFTAYTMEHRNAQNNTIHTAEVLLSTAIAARSYTSEEIQPLLIDRMTENFIMALTGS